MRRALLAALLAVLAPMAEAADGKAVYDTNCAACHQPDGNGAVGLAPPLAGTLGQRVASPAGRSYVAGVLISGLAGKIESKGVSYNGIMPNWSALSDEDLAAVANHVLDAFNKDQLAADHKPYAAEELAQVRARKPAAKEVKALRAESEVKAK